MKQKVKIFTSGSSGDIEKNINEFLELYEVRSVQLVTTPLPENHFQNIAYTALIKYQIPERKVGADFDEVEGLRWPTTQDE